MKAWAKSIFFGVFFTLASYGISVAMTMGAIHAAKAMGVTIIIAVDGDD